ncbi:Dna2/Cas4 domain-containing protein, partial [Xanthomonas sp. LMG 8992]|uniref:PD-(D/E)XK nuclease family protein n=1 Tax=Xanthomonas sp. LMG 8992 TaxID=1591157 RepID=UPI00136DBBE0
KNPPQYHTAGRAGNPGSKSPLVTPPDNHTKIVGYTTRVSTDPNTGKTSTPPQKTGRLPADSMQLHTYRYMLAQHGIQMTKGMFWTPATSRNDDKFPIQGTATELYDLDNNTYRHVSSMYSQAMKGISQGIFVPHVTALCKGCPVKDSCWAVNGKNSYRYPIESVVQPPEADNKEKENK